MPCFRGFDFAKMVIFMIKVYLKKTTILANALKYALLLTTVAVT
jgi:hypothetical protein